MPPSGASTRRSVLGSRYGEFFADCLDANPGAPTEARECARDKCSQIFSSVDAQLYEGCTWFVDWFTMPSDMTMVYARIVCPAALTTRSGLDEPGM